MGAPWGPLGPLGMKEGLHPKPGQEPPLEVGTPPPNHIQAIMNNNELDAHEIELTVNNSYSSNGR